MRDEGGERVRARKKIYFILRISFHTRKFDMIHFLVRKEGRKEEEGDRGSVKRAAICKSNH
jgi:hypothetical protein